MRLIDADALKEEVNKKNVIGRFNTLNLIDDAPTIPQITVFTENGNKEELEQELQKVLDGIRPKGEWIEFADFVARNVVSEDFIEDVDFYAEVLCRKLVKLGLVKLDGDIYTYCGANMKGSEEE